MTMPEEFTVPQAAAYLNVSEETVRRNIRSKRLKALPRIHRRTPMDGVRTAEEG